ncbi:MAG: hypothetical protein M3Y86_05980 [Verrucomicrobiota bacterium]|nr:hypothetical protein [Verrucomicrobiota bacterium]
MSQKKENPESTEKKPEVRVQDLAPKKDAKGGGGRGLDGGQRGMDGKGGGQDAGGGSLNSPNRNPNSGGGNLD